MDKQALGWASMGGLDLGTEPQNLLVPAFMAAPGLSQEAR